jgi:signal transduction histidine kinase
MQRMTNPPRAGIARFLSFTLLSFARVAAGPTVSEPLPALLTTAEEVRALGEAEVFVQHPVRLRGVVLQQPTTMGNSLVLADETAGIYIEAPPLLCKGLVRGNLIEARGHAVRGGFSPYVIADGIDMLGNRAPPPPTKVSFNKLASGRYDAQWVTITGTVRRTKASTVSGEDPLVEIASGGGRLGVVSRDPDILLVPVDAEVQVKGVVFYQFSRSGQMLRPLLALPDKQGIEVVVPPPADIPLKSIDKLLAFSLDGSFGHRVKVRGEVTHHVPGEALWLEFGGRAVRVKLDETQIYSPGEAVEVAGFVKLGNYSPELEDVTVKRLAIGSQPIPTRLESPAAAADHDAGFVTLRGRLLEKMRVPQGVRLVFSADNHDFPALLHHAGDQASLLDIWEVGALMDVTGICGVSRLPGNLHAGTVEPTEFDLIVRSPQDLLVIARPTWWNTERIAWYLAALALAFGGLTSATAWHSRRRLRMAAAARRQSEAEFAAILGERNRIAREIHDTLAQDLGAILLQHEMLKDLVPAGSEAQAHLVEANEIARDALAEARDSIWNMRSQALEDNGLGGALTGVLDQLTDRDGIEGTIEISGHPSPLPPMAENNLLRIGQEAITNAVKHASAKHIDVALEYTPNHVTLRVRDDGHGFDPAAVHPKDRHFGLAGMRERASEMGAQLHVESSPDQGTLLILELPIPERK